MFCSDSILQFPHLHLKRFKVLLKTLKCKQLNNKTLIRKLTNIGEQIVNMCACEHPYHSCSSTTPSKRSFCILSCSSIARISSSYLAVRYESATGSSTHAAAASSFEGIGDSSSARAVVLRIWLGFFLVFGVIIHF